jgi:hypothetical protein
MVEFEGDPQATVIAQNAKRRHINKASSPWRWPRQRVGTCRPPEKY